MLNLDSLVAGEPLGSLADAIDEKEEARNAWLQRRRGRFTGSRYDDLVRSGRGKDEIFSAGAWTYIYEVVGERLGSFRFEVGSRPTEWGHEHEDDARLEYLAKTGQQDCDTLHGYDSFTLLNDYTSSTPDVLVGKAGPAVEIKCPYTPQEHIRNMVLTDDLPVPKQHFWQCVGHLMVCPSRPCVDFVSFDPRIEGKGRMFVHRMEREQVAERIEWLRERVDLAWAEVVKILESM